MPTYTSQIHSALDSAAERNGLRLSDSVLGTLTNTVEDYLVSQGVLAGPPVNRVFPAAITGNSSVIRAELRRLASDNRLPLTDQVLDGLTTVVEGFLVAAGVLAGVGDPGNTPEQNLSNLQERIEEDPEPQDLPRLRETLAAPSPFADPEPAATVDTDEAYEVVRGVLKFGADGYFVNLKAANLNDLTSLVVDFLVERGLLA